MTIDALFVRACFAGVCLVCVLTSAGCGSRPVEHGLSVAKLPFGVVDTPHSGDTLRGAVGVGGWALSEDGIGRVAIYIDRKYVVTATLAGSRPDVAGVYRDVPEAGSSGWNAVVDTAAFTPGAHEIVVQAQSKQGGSRDIGAITVTLAK
jgi:hypothetical protein